ncbi:MAG: TetR/AcrR family transcriptional regulator [Methanobacteriaceae archaeon]
MNIKNKIAETAFLLALQKGFDSVSIRNISEESGISIGGIYYHFKNKTEILKYIIVKYFSTEIIVFKNVLQKEDNLIEKLKFILYNQEELLYSEDDIIGFSKSDNIDFREYFLLMMGIYHQYPEVRDEYDKSILNVFNFFKELVEESIEKGEIKDDIDPHKLATHILSIYLGILLTSVEFTYIPFKELVSTNLEFLWNNVKK